MNKNKISSFLGRQFFNSFQIFNIFSKQKIYASLAAIKQNFTGQDALFQYLIALCLGLFLPLFALLTTKGVIVLFGIVGFFITLRIFMRPIYQPAMIAFVKSPHSLVFICFIVLIALQSVHSLIQGELVHNTVGNAIKPILILLLFYISLGYLSLNKKEAFSEAVSIFFLIGASLFMVLLGLDIIKNYLILLINGSQYIDTYNIGGWATNILKQNIGLQFFAALLFLIPLHQEKLKLPSASIHSLVLCLLIISFINIGNYSLVRYNMRHIGAEATQVGLVASWLVFVLTKYYPRLITHLFFSATTLLILFSPWIFYNLFAFFEKFKIMQGTLLHIRLEIWRYVSEKIMVSPFLGAGLSSGKNIANFPVYHHYDNATKLHPHPHNIFLEIWLDLGILGAFLSTVLLIMAWSYTLRTAEKYRAGFVACLTMIAILGMVSHSLWQSWWLCLIAIILLHLSLFSHKQESKKV